jgi:cyclase
LTVRLIARMDIKGPDLIKPVNLEGVRKVGNPNAFALDYYRQGIDEIIYMDAVASLYGRNSLDELVRQTARQVFVPMTVGGGIRSLADVEKMLRAGADKVAINTGAIRDPSIIDAVATRFGSQCMVLSIEAKARPDRNGWEAYVDSGREKTGIDAIAWAREGVERGAGEILVTSVDMEGMRRGFDLRLTRAVSDAVPVPVIASGGMGAPEHLLAVLEEGRADAVAIAHVLHFRQMTVADLRATLRAAGIATR